MSGPLGLPFEEVWCIDFEFIAPDGETPDVVCMVARELGSNQLLRLWRDHLGAVPPFRTDAAVLFVAYNVVAEVSCFLALGWPVPERLIDPYVEHVVDMNGRVSPLGLGFLAALAHHGITSITADEKESWRTRIMAGPPFDEADRAGILDYCQTDVDPLPALLERQLPTIRLRGAARAVYRARYMVAVARMERAGVPIDVEALGRIRDSWEPIKLALIANVDQAFHVYDGTTFRAVKFRRYLAEHGIPWPTEDGRVKLDGDTFRDMSRPYPEVVPLYELRHTLGELRLENLAVGADGRNRTSLMPYRARTGRNLPSNTKFVFGPAKWIRRLIVPPSGRALAYLDWKSQEVYIAAYLSGDPAMIAAVESGDPYLSFAKMSGLAPEGATKETHGPIRAVCKTVVLGTMYGMREHSLAYRIDQHPIEARELLRRLAVTWPIYTSWTRDNQARAQLTGQIETVFGWPMHVTGAQSPNALLNYPMQANGAEMLRLACCLMTEAGIAVCAPVHDAVLIEAGADSIEEVAADAAALMRRAARVVLDGVSVPVDLEQIIRPGMRYIDPDNRDTLWPLIARHAGIGADEAVSALSGGGRIA